MGVYINMEMPKESDEWIETAIFGDGKVIQTGESWRNPENGKCYYATTTPENFFNAVPVHPHGRLVDADAFAAEMKARQTAAIKWMLESVQDHDAFIRAEATVAFLSEVKLTLDKMPTIIPTEEGE